MKIEKCRDIISSLPSHFCARKRLDLLAKREVEQSCIVISSKPTDASGLRPVFFAAIVDITAYQQLWKLSLAEIYNWIRRACAILSFLEH